MTEEFVDIFAEDFDFSPTPLTIYVDGHFIYSHPHAFIKDNVVINVAVFNEHDHELIDAVRIANNADWVQCVCDYGKTIAPGWIWNGTEFVEAINNG